MAKKIEGFNKKARQPSSAIKIPVQLYRIVTNMQKFRNAVTSAENFQNPQRYELYQLYQQTMLDPQVNACWTQAKNLVMGSGFCVYNKDGSDNEEKTKWIRRKWFRDFVSLSLDAHLWSHSLPQFGDIITRDGINEFTDVELVPREYVKPEFNRVVPDTGSMPEDGIDYTELPYRNWCVGVGSKRDLGLLLKLTPLVIWKKNAFGAWAEFTEKFGTPIRIGKTDRTDKESTDNMENMLRNMGVSAWGMFGTDDLIELIQVNNTDAYEVFDKMIERCNSEIAKLILCQTMTTDNGSSKSQAEVHERMLNMVGDSLRQFIYSVLNDQLIPLLNEHGFGLDGCYIDVEQEDEWDLTEKSTFDLGLINSGKFTLTPEYIKEKYGTEVIKVEEPKDDSFNKYKDVLLKTYT